ncbi:MAG: class I SAM-dependent methyltransferase [Solirubrobacterales bacterium]
MDPELGLADRLRVAKWRATQRIRRRGDAVECPCCGRTWSSFVPFDRGGGTVCAGCFSLERMRGLWLWLTRSEAIAAPARILHLAPEPCLEPLLRRSAGDRYVTADLDPQGVDVELDVTAMPFEDARFDLVLCSHVLEHVDDDRAGMRELRRVAAPGATVVVLVPLLAAGEPTREDPSVSDPDERLARFGQEDHVRIYGRDLSERLREAGLIASPTPFGELFPAADHARYGLDPEELLILCRPSGAG